MIANEVDVKRSEAFAERMVGMLNEGSLALLTSIGHQTGLFDTLAQLPPATSGQIAASSHVHCNVDLPTAPFLYTVSTMHCMTVSLAQGGAGLGTVWGRETAQHMLREAGFADVSLKRLDYDIFNDYYIARPSRE